MLDSKFLFADSDIARGMPTTAQEPHLAYFLFLIKFYQNTAVAFYVCTI